MAGAADEIRLATPDEAGDVAACLTAFRDFLGSDTPTADAMARGVAHLLDSGLAEYLVVGRPAHSVAQLRFVYSVWVEAPTCWVEDIFVVDEHRGRGLGRAMMEAATSLARARGCREMHLDANERNTNAVALYESMGFTSVSPDWDGGRDHFFRRLLDDA